MKLTKEDINKVRHIEGFPIARDEDIIALSNPPYYTACPNPFIEDFVKEHGKPYDEATDDYHREPFAADVSEGKNDPIYNLHSYHTKVPHKAIMRYILHYTDPGDIVFDGFCGTGMTGVAAWMCENPDPKFKLQLEKEMPGIKWGTRNAILNDLSPAATFIAYNYNTPVDIVEFEKEAKRILKECEKECGWMYETRHTAKHSTTKLQMRTDDSSDNVGRINYTVWSDVFICPNCGVELVFWDLATDKTSGKVKDSFLCKSCGISLKKTSCKRALSYYNDEIVADAVSISKQVPVLINYTFNGKKYEKTPDEMDLSRMEKINALKIPYSYPVDDLPKGVNTAQPQNSHGVNRVYQFYTKRNLYVLAFIYSLLELEAQPLKNTLIFTFEQLLLGMSKLARYVPTHYSQVNQYLSGTLYIGSQVVEVTPNYILNNKISNLSKTFSKFLAQKESVIISTNSLTMLMVPDNCMDYIFTDPPFGDNLNYSELSFIWEAWLKIKTNNETEAIVNRFQKKDMLEYQNLMTVCFKEYYRVLKPGRWMTIEFHNSKNAVWNAIQEALQKSGFVVADVRTLDKQQGSFKQMTSTATVKQDLVISVYKPKESFKREFMAHAGNVDTAWDFVRQHLEKLPVIVVINDKIELIAERQAFLLFDRMVAYHIMNGVSVPIDAADFYKGLDEKFLKRDGMYFLHDQINEYDTARITTEVEPVQMVLNVKDEKSAIAWLYGQLDIPQTYAEIQPKFMQEIRAIDKYEKLPELSVLLEDNFLQNDEGKWYIPDITKSADVIKLREKRLIKEFEEYLNSTGKLKLFRTEAIRAGFAKLWKDRNYALIVKTADRLPEKLIQEDDKLLMYYDISLSRME